MTRDDDGPASYGHLDLSGVIQQWDGLRKFERELLKPADQRTDLGLTARKFDEAQPAGHRVYIGAGSQISNGLEHIDALQTLLQHSATPRAPWTLLRSVYEAGFWACWLLEPNDGQTRRRRGLHAEVQSMKQRAAFYATFLRYKSEEPAKATRDHPRHEQTYRAECASLGLPWSLVSNKINVIDELDKLRYVQGLEKDIRAALQATWRSLSGMQHGHAYALMINSDMQPGVTKIAGGALGTITIKDEAFVAAVSAANMLLLESMKLYVLRCTRQ